MPIVDARNGVKVAACRGELSVTAFEAVMAAPSPSPNPLRSLTTTLDAPPSVHAGTVLRYTVRVRNDGRERVTFAADCPAYLQWAGNQVKAFAKDSRVLNCRPVQSIGPNEGVSFAMQMAVPAGTDTGDYTLYWNFVGFDVGLPGKASVHVE